MVDVYLFQSLVVVGPIRECRKWIRLVQTSDNYRFFNPESCGFANMYPHLTIEDSNQLSLQQILAQKILDKYRTHGLQRSDIEGLPDDLLAKIVDRIPLVVPALKQDLEKKIAFNLNFEERDAFIQAIKNLKSETSNQFDPTVFTDQFDRGGILYYSFFNYLLLPSTDKIPKMLKDNNINVDIVARDSCDWDIDPTRNSFTKIFVIENHEVTFQRPDLPQTIQEDDHPLVHKYGHLLKTWKEIRDEKRKEFTSETLGDFKQFWRAPPRDFEIIDYLDASYLS